MQNRILSTRKLFAFACYAMGLWFAATAWAVQSGQAQVSEIKGYVYADGGFFQELTASSPAYSANLDANGFGNFGWRLSNTSGAALQNVRFVVFLDADLDKATTTFFNEYGSFINLSLPPGTMTGDVAATSWEIDEPGFVFGDIAQHLLSGALDNTNAVPMSAPDDVALALGFQLGALPAGSSLDAKFIISQSDIGGLAQTDVTTNSQLFFNGYLRPEALTINSVATARQQGSSGTVSTIANLQGGMLPLNNATVTAENVPAGITVNEIVNTNGAITARVAASCDAALGANTLQLRATNGGATALGNFTVNVTANTPPALGTYPAAGPLSLGGGVTVTSDAPPMDNGAVTNITAASPSFSGNFNVSPTSGAVTVTNAGPVGNYTVTVTATDNCSATTTRTFALTILQADADLVISKTASANRVLAGSNVSYNITVTNNGPATASAITVTDLLPSNTTFVSCGASGGGVCGGIGASQTITIASLPAAASATITLVVRVNPTVTSGTIINNTASISSASPDANTANNTATARITVASEDCPNGNCPPVGPGLPYPADAEVSDQKSGSVLVYNLYTSSATNPNLQNTRINLTNTDPSRAVAAHLFFVDGASCAVADAYVCLTANQTTSFTAADLDPGTTGYLVVVAVDRATGCPINFNHLIGDAYVKLQSGHEANLGAEAFAALPGGLPACNSESTTAVLNFDGISYNRAPRVLAADNLPDRAGGNDTLLVINRLGGNLAIGAETLGAITGLLYNDAEQAFSFTFNPGACQFRASLNNNFPRTTPRYEQVIPAGRSGWIRFWSASDAAILGAVINYNPAARTAAGAFNQGRNLHKLRLTTAASLTIPIFAPNC